MIKCFNLSRKTHLGTWLTALLILLSMGVSYAAQQNMSVSGTVVDQNGEPLIGVSILVSGTKNVATTNYLGQYTIKNVPAKGKLEFSYMGFVTQIVPVYERATIDVVMVEEATRLQDVVVTAEFGVKRTARAVGAAIQNLTGTDIIDSGRDNFVTALQGRVAGISINSGGGVPGASTQVILRNYTSISGNNQPLYVIDGIPLNNTTFNPSQGFAVDDAIADRQLDFSSRGNDFNPEDIESMTVLKGAAAAALYGSDASNGAIIITTRKGTVGKGRVRYSNSFRFDKSYGLPEIQTKYDLGSYGTTNYYNKSRWGDEYAAGTKLYDNVAALTQTGFTQKHNVSFEGGSKIATFRAAASYLDQTGIVKTTAYKRFNISLAGTANITQWLSTEASMSYASTSNNKARKGAGGALDYAMSWPSTDNMSDYLAEDGIHMRVPDRYLDGDFYNPLFALHKNKYYDESNRFTTSFSVNINPTKNFFVIARAGWDVGLQTFETSEHPYFAYNNDGIGVYNISKSNFNDPTLNLIAGYKKEIKKFSLSAQAGWHSVENGVNRLSSYGTDYLVADFISLNNCDKNSIKSRTTNTKRRVLGVSGSVELSYDNMIFLTLRARNDWSSTLPKNNNSYFYPAADFTFVLSDLPFLKNSKYINYLKLRASIAKVGKDANPLAIYPALESQTTTGGGYKYGFTGPNESLKPEMTTSWEVGLEGRFLNDRLFLDMGYFNTLCENQYVTGFRLSYATGFVLNNMNVGTFKTSGFEFHVDGDIVKNRHLRWNVGLNLSHNDSEVTYLPENVTEYYNAYTWNSGNIRNGVKVGYPITSLTGRAYERNEAGRILINPTTGQPRISSVWSYLGDREPKLRYSFTTSLRYRGLAFSALFDGRLGATVVNGTKRLMMQRGLSWESVRQREAGPVVFDGVLYDGLQNTDHPTQNTIAVNFGQCGSTTYSGGDESWIEKNVNFLRLRELRLSYRFAAEWIKSKTSNLISDLSVYITGNDLFVWTNYSGIDAIGNTNSAALGGTGGVGMDVYAIPSPRGMSFGLNITF